MHAFAFTALTLLISIDSGFQGIDEAGYPSIMLPVYLPTGIFPYSFFTFLPSCYASEGGAFFITNAG